MKSVPHPFYPVLWMCCVLLTTGSFFARAQSDNPTATNPIVVPIGPVVASGSPQLTGSLSALKISKPDDAKYTSFKTTLTLNNAGPTVARNVTATLFVSSNPYLDASSSKLKDIVLPAGKIGKNKSTTLLIKYHVSTLIASYFEGKYLLVSFRAENVPFGIGHPASAPVATEQIKLF